MPTAGKSIDDLEMEMIDAGAEDVEVDTEDGVMIAYTDFNNFVHFQRALEERNVEVASAEMQRIPLNTVSLTDEQMEELSKLIDKIEEDDDVQNVFHNIA